MPSNLTIRSSQPEGSCPYTRSLPPLGHLVRTCYTEPVKTERVLRMALRWLTRTSQHLHLEVVALPVTQRQEHAVCTVTESYRHWLRQQDQLSSISRQSCCIETCRSASVGNCQRSAEMMTVSPSVERPMSMSRASTSGPGIRAQGRLRNTFGLFDHRGDRLDTFVGGGESSGPPGPWRPSNCR